MNRNYTTSQIRLYLIGSIILLAGLSCAVYLYLTATEDTSDVISYVFVDGQEYPVRAEDSRRYQNDLARIGGKSALLADEIDRWFDSLWQGKRFACLLALLSIGAALGCFLAARQASNGRPGGEGEDR